MPVFPRPKFEFNYDVAQEVARLNAHKKARGIPARHRDFLLFATWNIANFGAQERRNEDKALIAEVLSWFELIAVQECRENYADLEYVQHLLPPSFKVLMSDASGNNERMVFLYDTKKLTLLEEVGEVAFPPADFSKIKLPGITQGFTGFDRTPYLASFAVGKTSITFVNIHLYFGKDKEGQSAKDRRALEAFAVARWADRRSKSDWKPAREVVVAGDANVEKAAPNDPIFSALTKLGLDVPDHSTMIGSSISADKQYDQIAFLPGTTKELFRGVKGVFDFDAVVFPELWDDGRNEKNFRAYLRYYLSDHRPMWVQMALPTP